MDYDIPGFVLGRVGAESELAGRFVARQPGSPAPRCSIRADRLAIGGE